VSDARTAILARLRAAQRTALLPRMDETPLGLEPATADPAACLERFTRELAALGVEGHVEASAEAARARVAALIAGKRVLCWDPEHLPYELGGLVGDAARGGDDRDRQAAAEIGLTGVDAAIAETGSLVVISGKGKARSVSLLPPAYVAVVRRQDLCFSMGECFRRLEPRMAPAACTTVITGPSRTADIELQLTLGVHGPGKVAVVIGP